jgi:hypothetical protein
MSQPTNTVSQYADGTQVVQPGFTPFTSALPDDPNFAGDVSVGGDLTVVGEIDLDSGQITSDGNGNIVVNSINGGQGFFGEGATIGNLTASGGTLFSGNGVPIFEGYNAGDFYFRQDGGTGTHIYFLSVFPSTWVPII